MASSQSHREPSLVPLFAAFACAAGILWHECQFVCDLGSGEDPLYHGTLGGRLLLTQQYQITGMSQVRPYHFAKSDGRLVNVESWSRSGDQVTAAIERRAWRWGLWAGEFETERVRLFKIADNTDTPELRQALLDAHGQPGHEVPWLDGQDPWYLGFVGGNLERTRIVWTALLRDVLALASVATLVVTTPALVRRIRATQTSPEGCCPACNYLLEGLPAYSRCPECGAIPEDANCWGSRP